MCKIVSSRSRTILCLANLPINNSRKHVQNLSGSNVTVIPLTYWIGEIICSCLSYFEQCALWRHRCNEKAFFCTTFEVFFLTRIIWYELIFFLGKILNHLGPEPSLVEWNRAKNLKGAAWRDNFFLHETIKRFFYSSGKFERI